MTKTTAEAANCVAAFLRTTSRWLAILAICFTSVDVSAAEFSIDPDGAFRIHGHIVKGDFEKWMELTRGHDASLLRVTSGGGLAIEAIKIARDMHRRNLDIEVDRACASACFIYLFVAANKKIIKPGALVVGHHDSTQNMAMLPDQAKRQIRESAEKEAPDLDEDAIEKQVRRDMRELQGGASMECRFAKDMGVNPAFYNDVAYVLADWREHFGGELPDGARPLWWPSASVLERRYGISNVHDAARPEALDTRGWWLPPVTPPIIILGDQVLDQAAAWAAKEDRLAAHAQCNFGRTADAASAPRTSS